MEDCNNAYCPKYVTDVPLGKQTDGHTWEGGIECLPHAGPGLGHLGRTHRWMRWSPCWQWAHPLERHTKATAIRYLRAAEGVVSDWDAHSNPSDHFPGSWPRSGTWKEKESRGREPGVGRDGMLPGHRGQPWEAGPPAVERGAELLEDASEPLQEAVCAACTHCHPPSTRAHHPGHFHLHQLWLIFLHPEAICALPVHVLLSSVLLFATHMTLYVESPQESS